jgi:hypothetical protein
MSFAGRVAGTARSAAINAEPDPIVEHDDDPAGRVYRGSRGFVLPTPLTRRGQLRLFLGFEARTI